MGKGKWTSEECSKIIRKVLRTHLRVDDREFLVVSVSPEEPRQLDASMENVDGSVPPKLRFYQMGGMENKGTSVK